MNYEDFEEYSNEEEKYLDDLNKLKNIPSIKLKKEIDKYSKNFHNHNHYDNDESSKHNKNLITKEDSYIDLVNKIYELNKKINLLEYKIYRLEKELL